MRAAIERKKPIWIVHPQRTCPFLWPELQLAKANPGLEEMIQVRQKTFDLCFQFSVFCLLSLVSKFI